MRNDNAPCRYTCPTIDSVIAFIENMDSYDINNEDELSDMKRDIKDAVALMENIRSDNSALRDWGNGLHQDKEDLENDIYSLNDEIADLQNQIYNYKDVVKDLEEEIKELQTQTT